MGYARLGRLADAEETLGRAVVEDPDSGFAMRNLAGVLAKAGKHADALPWFRRLAGEAPGDPALRLALAQTLEALGGDHLREARELHRQILTRFPRSAAGDAAGANRLATADLHDAVGGEPRPDAITYMQAALEQFAQLPRPRLGEVVMEIALLGQCGLAVNAPAKRYRLKTLPGDFSGLQLISMLHVGVRLLDPNADPGTGLEREYAIAAGPGGTASR